MDEFLAPYHDMYSSYYWFLIVQVSLSQCKNMTTRVSWLEVKLLLCYNAHLVLCIYPLLLRMRHLIIVGGVAFGYVPTNPSKKNPWSIVSMLSCGGGRVLCGRREQEQEQIPLGLRDRQAGLGGLQLSASEYGLALLLRTPCS